MFFLFTPTKKIILIEKISKYETTTNAIFLRFLAKIESRTFVNYFSYHKVIVSFVQNEVPVNLPIE